MGDSQSLDESQPLKTSFQDINSEVCAGRNAGLELKQVEGGICIYSRLLPENECKAFIDPNNFTNQQVATLLFNGLTSNVAKDDLCNELRSLTFDHVKMRKRHQERAKELRDRNRMKTDVEHTSAKLSGNVSI